MGEPTVFEETYETYLERISELDLVSRQAILGIDLQNDQAVVPFFNTDYHVGPGGISDAAGHTPHLSVCVVLCKYLLMCPHETPQTRGLATFKDFKDAAPLIHYFSNNVQGEVVRQFEGRTPALESACRDLGAIPYGGELAYQVKYQFKGLPRVPIYLLYNDAEEGFPAQCTLLFKRSTEAFLDMESVSMLAGSLVHMLTSRQ